MPIDENYFNGVGSFHLLNLFSCIKGCREINPLFQWTSFVFYYTFYKLIDLLLGCFLFHDWNNFLIPVLLTLLSREGGDIGM